MMLVIPTPVRIAVGTAILAGFAIVDLARNGKNATRWREYSFLLGTLAVAVAYGVANDQITCRISWEYFYYGKNLADALHHQVPPDPRELSRQAVKVGAMATWWVGLLGGAVLLIANNPSKKFPQLSYRELMRQWVAATGIAAVCALLLGIAGYFYLLNWISDEFADMVLVNLYRPHRFLAVYGVHLGGYVCGVLGIGWAVVRVRVRRKL